MVTRLLLKRSLISIALVLGVVMTSSGTSASPAVTFPQSVTLPITEVNDIVVGDLDKDGHQDVLDTTATGFTVFYGHGNATFDRVDYALTGGLLRPHVADVNGDGLPDIVASNYYGNNIVVFINGGNRTFHAGVSYTTDLAPAGIADGDFNGDGKTDLVVANNHARNFSVLLNNGDGTFKAAVNYPGGSYPISVAVGAFHGGSVLDIAETSHYENYTRIYQGNGLGQFTSAGTWAIGGGDISVNDFNLSGGVDMAIDNYWSAGVAIGLGNGAGGMTSSSGVSGVTYPGTIATADLNSDGYPDVVVPNATTGAFSVILNAGDGTLGARESFTTPGTDTRQAYIGDFNEDGQPDVVIASSSGFLVIYLNGTLVVPTITAVNPAIVLAGSGDTQITVTGAQFLSDAQVKINGTALVTTDSSSTSLTAVVPAALLTTPGAYPLTVSNGESGGGTSTPAVFNVSYPVPVLTSLDPWVVTIGAPPSVKLFGTGLYATSRVYANTTAVKGVLNTDGSMSVYFPTAMFAQTGTIVMRVFNPTPGGGMSNPLDLSVFNPTPAITSLSPSSIPIGSGQTTVTINGTGFLASSTVNVGGKPVAATFNAGALSVTLPQSMFTAIKNLSFTVTNSTPGGGTSAPVALPIVYPTPVLTSIHTTAVPVGAASFVLYAAGTGFVPGASQIVFGSLVLPASVTVTGEWYATIPASALSVAGSYRVALRNPAPGGGTSNIIMFAVKNPVPHITALTPNSGTAGTVLPISVTGTGFLPTSQINFGSTVLPTALNSDGSLSATVPAKVAGGVYAVTVVNPGPGGGPSNGLPLTISYPKPTLVSLHTTSVAAGSAAFVLYAQGTGYVANASQILFGTLALPASVTVSGEWYATIPASALANKGTIQVALKNPTPGGGTTSTLPFTVK